MITLRCTSKLLKRLRQPAKLPEPPAPTNPLAAWYADLDFFERKPFVTLLNASTGAGLVLPGHAEFLKQLHVHAGQQLCELLLHYGFKATLIKYRRRHPPCLSAGHRAVGEGRLAVC